MVLSSEPSAVRLLEGTAAIELESALACPATNDIEAVWVIVVPPTVAETVTVSAMVSVTDWHLEETVDLALSILG